jgi:magnesium transporter
MKRLTVINVVFMPLNVLAGVGGMSEFSMMTKGIAWPLAYSAFMLVLTIIGLSTYKFLRWHEDVSIRKGIK